MLDAKFIQAFEKAATSLENIDENTKLFGIMLMQILLWMVLLKNLVKTT